jgi:hypothetical protein
VNKKLGCFLLVVFDLLPLSDKKVEKYKKKTGKILKTREGVGTSNFTTTTGHFFRISKMSF